MSDTVDWGIDLGTTNSAIALHDGVHPHLIAGPHGSVLLRSSVEAGPDGLQVPLCRDGLLSERCASEFKRAMGTSERIALGGGSYAPEELSACVLKELVAWAEPIHGAIEAAVITVPAVFKLPQCEATRRAATLAGLAHVVLLQEPIAAAVAYADLNGHRDGHWLIYDLGGGTFDVSLVRAKRGRLQVLDHDGDNHLGGRDLDREVALWALDRARESGRFGALDRGDPRYDAAWKQLHAGAEKVRVALSGSEAATLRVAQLVCTGSGAGETFETPLERAQLSALLAPVFARTVRLCRAVLARTRVTARDLHGVVLVGGPTRDPALAQLLEAQLGAAVHASDDPMTLVARGAALFAATQRNPAATRTTGGANVALEYESMTTNPAPLIAGRAERLRGGWIRAVRQDGAFDTGELAVGTDGRFALELELVTGAVNTFQLTARNASGPVAVMPAQVRICHGFSIAAPLLGQSLGVMLKDDRVAWYLSKGDTLPAKSRQVHATTLSLRPGSGAVVQIPLVQGESEIAERNRVVGVIRIEADSLQRDLPAGSEVHVELEVDASSRTTSRAYVPTLDRWLEEVVWLGMESASAAQVKDRITHQRGRLETLAALAEDLEQRPDDRPERAVTSDYEATMQRIEKLVGEGDGDALEVADGLVRDLAELIDTATAQTRAERLHAEFLQVHAYAVHLLTAHGDDAEKRQLNALSGEFWAALESGELDRAERRLADVVALIRSVRPRTPEYWRDALDSIVEQLSRDGLLTATDPELFAAREAFEAGDVRRLAQACRNLAARMPAEQRPAIPTITSQVR